MGHDRHRHRGVALRFTRGWQPPVGVACRAVQPGDRRVDPRRAGRAVAGLGCAGRGRDELLSSATSPTSSTTESTCRKAGALAAPTRHPGRERPGRSRRIERIRLFCRVALDAECRSRKPGTQDGSGSDRWTTAACHGLVHIMLRRRSHAGAKVDVLTTYATGQLSGQQIDKSGMNVAGKEQPSR